MQDCKVNILGTEYYITKKSYKDEPAFERRGIDGYCNGFTHEIVYCDLDTDDKWQYENEETKRKCETQTIRHEIVHAFLFESGLRESSHGIEHGWAVDEEIVDWMANQIPKIYKAFEEVGAL